MDKKEPAASCEAKYALFPKADIYFNSTSDRNNAILENLSNSLASMVAHDLNNLLTVISGCSHVINDGLDELSDLKMFNHKISKACDLAATLTKQLMIKDINSVLPVETDLNEIISKIEPVIRCLAGDKIIFNYHLAADIGLVKANPGHLEQIIINLVVNARDAMPDGGTLSIKTSCIEQNDSFLSEHEGMKHGMYALLSVCDNGCGMDQKTIARIFEPNFTSKSSSNGMGLGLATVHEIVNKAGGYIFVKSLLSYGTTFSIYLPLQPNETIVEQFQNVTAAKIIHRTQKNKTILIVDDSDDILSLTGDCLKNIGYRVIEAKNAQCALQAAEKYYGEIHLLLTDVFMQGTNGLELAKQLQQTRTNLKILLMSGCDGYDLAEKSGLNEKFSFIPKPFNMTSLEKKINEALYVPNTELSWHATPENVKECIY